MEQTARFVEGSILRHVVVMAGTGAIGLIAIFAVDLVNLLYLSLLHDRTITAAIGFAGVIGFFQVSIAIGISIGIGAVVSRAIGAGHLDEARRLAASSFAAMLLVTIVIAVLTVVSCDEALRLLGATVAVRSRAELFVVATAPSLPMLGVGMGAASLLRSVGDARRAMNVTLMAAIATACLDPLLIFGLHLGLTGAAISTILSRCVLAAIGWQGTRRHSLPGRLQPSMLIADTRRLFYVAGPAIVTNLATPVGSAFVTSQMARFGVAAVTGQVTVDRIAPVAFGLVFALSGAVGPIMAQNLGAWRMDRVRATLRQSLLVGLGAVALAWLILAAGQDLVVRAFAATGITASLIHLFCSVTAAGFLGIGCLFVANASFNNLGFPLLSTLFNWGRATLGTIPFVTYGARFGPAGILYGQAAGALLFGVVAMVVAFRVTARLRPTGEAPRRPATVIEPLALRGKARGFAPGPH